MAVKKSRVTGAKEIRANGQKIIKYVRDRSLVGITKTALTINKESKEEAPVRGGNMRSTGFVVNPKDGQVGSSGDFQGPDAGKMASQHGRVISDSVSVVASMSQRFGAAVAVGFTAFYALIVHENPRAGAAGYAPGKDIKGKKAQGVHSKVGKWKFLEDPLKRNTGRIKSDLATATKLPGGKI